MNHWIIITYKHSPPGSFEKSEQESQDYYDDIHLLLERVVELARKNKLFAVHKVGECIGDFS